MRPIVELVASNLTVAFAVQFVFVLFGALRGINRTRFEFYLSLGVGFLLGTVGWFVVSSAFIQGAL